MTFFLWSKTAITNQAVDPTVNLREGQGAGSLNDAARAQMAASAKFRDDITGALLTSGSSSAYTVSSNENFNQSGSATTIPDGLTLALRVHATNAASATLTVDGITGARPIRLVSGQSIPAGYLIAGSPYRFYYNLANDEWVVFGAFGNPYGIPLGGFLDYVSTTPPNSNFVLPFGQAISRTTYANLFTLISTTFGTGDGSTTFNLPDVRGRAFFGLDNMGGSAANRIVTANGAIDGATIGAVGGADHITMLRSDMPNVAPTFSGTAVPDHGHLNGPQKDCQGLNTGGSVTHVLCDSASNATPQGNQPNTPATGLAGGHTPAGTISSLNGGVTQTAMKQMPPAMMMPKLLRVL